MGDERFSNLVVTLNGYKLRTDSVSIADVAQEFVSSNEDCKRNFSTAENKAVRGVHARASVERRSRKTPETRAAAGSFACLGRFARRTKRKERLLVVYANAR